MPALNIEQLRRKACPLGLYLLDLLEQRGELLSALMHAMSLPESNRTHMYGILQGKMVLKVREAIGLAHHFGVPVTRIVALYHGVSEDDEIVGASVYDIYMRLPVRDRRVVNALLNALLQALLEQQEEQEHRQGSPGSSMEEDVL